MSDTTKDQEKGDEVLRRLLKTPPDPKTGKGEKGKADDQQRKETPHPRNHADR